MRKTKKQLATLGLAVMLASSMSMTAFADQWQQDTTGWWYEQDGGYAIGWQWIDGKCYYFDGNGYMAKSTVIDGYTLNEDGQWIVNGVVQTQQVDPHINPINVETSNVTGDEVTDGKSVAQITMNQELLGLFRTDDGISNFPVSLGTMTGVGGNTDIYSVNYNNTILEVMIHREINQITGYLGEAKVLLNNIPTQGIELNAFYSNTGFKDANNGRRYVASTGNSDQLFGLQTGTYRMTQFFVGNYVASIVLTRGEDGNWYIYPNNQMHFN